MTDPTDRLIRAWIAWDNAPSAPWVCNERLDAIAAAGLDSCATHAHIAAARLAGMTIPDAVQTAINAQHPEAA